MKQAAVLLVMYTTFLVGLSIEAYSETRFALAIGNGNYAQVLPLKNPINDAHDMNDMLKDLGFTVSLLTDASRSGMEKAVSLFGAKLHDSPESIGFFYYAGHGVQYNGTNYLIPADAEILDPALLPDKALSLQSILRILGDAGNKLNVLVIDACRDNPFPWSRSVTRGLVLESARATGIIVAYAAGEGQAAFEGTGRNGIYTGELLKYLQAPGLEIDQVLKQTGAAVEKSTNRKQIPERRSTYNGNFYMIGTDPATVDRELAAIQAQVATLKSSLETARNQAEKDRLALELQKEQAAEAVKRLEAETLATQQARWKELLRRENEAQDELIKNQTKAQQELEKVRQASEEKRKLLEEIGKIGASYSTTVKLIVETESTIGDISKSIGASRAQTLARIKTYYAQKNAEVAKLVKDPWEKSAEFDQRKRSLLQTYAKNESAETQQANKDYDQELDKQTRELKARVEQYRSSVFVLTGSELSVQLGDYASEAEEFTFTAKSMNKDVVLRQ